MQCVTPDIQSFRENRLHYGSPGGSARHPVSVRRSPLGAKDPMIMLLFFWLIGSWWLTAPGVAAQGPANAAGHGQVHANTLRVQVKQPRTQYVLLLNSYSKGYAWTDNQVRGIFEVPLYITPTCDTVVIMSAKVFWYATVFLFGLAVLLASIGGRAGWDAVLNYRCWGLVSLGSLSAVLGNILRASASGEGLGHGDSHHHRLGY